MTEITTNMPNDPKDITGEEHWAKKGDVDLYLFRRYSPSMRAANPDKPVLAVCGDGGFMYNVQELATAVLHRIPLVTIVFNDNAYGNVKRTQIQSYGGKVIASDLHNPDFVRLAEWFGAAGALAKTPEELKTEIRKGFDEKGPTLIEVPVGDMPNPWHMIMEPPVRPKRTSK